MFDKICSKCNLRKPTQWFSKDKRNKSGLDSYCRDCRRAISAEYDLANKYKRQIYFREYNATRSRKAKALDFRALSRERYLPPRISEPLLLAQDYKCPMCTESIYTDLEYKVDYRTNPPTFYCTHCFNKL